MTEDVCDIVFNDISSLWNYYKFRKQVNGHWYQKLKMRSHFSMTSLCPPHDALIKN